MADLPWLDMAALAQLGGNLPVALAGLTLVFGLALGWLLASLRKGRQLTRLREALEAEQRAGAERSASLERMFSSLSAEALRHNNRTFLQLAQEVLARFHVQARGDLELKEQAVRDLVRPIRETLNRTEQQLHQLERDRRESHGALNRHLETMTETQQALHSETRNLVQALRRPEVRGQWGELTLRRLAELAGMVEHCDFEEQVSSPRDGGSMRPDMIVRMPGGRQVVVDVKTPLDAYLGAVEAADETARQRQLRLHAQHVRARVRELAAKRYWDQFREAPEFVILFIPGDQFLSAAMDQDAGLLEDALARKVILATPTSFVALLRAVAYGWRQDSLNRNAERIRVVGEELYHRVATLAEHLARLGRHLDASITQYNRVVGSYESKVLPGARTFVDLGVTPRKDAEAPAQIEKGARNVSEPDN